MAWSKTQIAAAKKLYNRKGNRLSWSECIARATKGGTRTKKKAAVSGTGKKKAKPAKKVVAIKKVKNVNVNMGVGGTAMGYVRDATNDIQRMEKKLQAATPKEKKELRKAISNLKKTKTIWKSLL